MSLIMCGKVLKPEHLHQLQTLTDSITKIRKIPNAAILLKRHCFTILRVFSVLAGTQQQKQHRHRTFRILLTNVHFLS